jgi:hypothetical protein
MSYTRGSESKLRQVKDEKIKSVSVVRTPLSWTLMTMLNTVSFGEFRRKMANKPYDDLYHLMLYIETDNTVMSIERNELVNVETRSKRKNMYRLGLGIITNALSGNIFNKEELPRLSDASESMHIRFPQGLTIGEFVRAGEAFMGPKYGRYSARDNNCQDFVVNMLRANAMSNVGIEAWIKQDTKDLFDDEGYLRRFTNTVTDAGAIIAPYKPMMASDWRDKDRGMNLVMSLPLDDVFKQGQKIANYNVPFMRFHGVPMSASHDYHPDSEVMFARKKKGIMKLKNFGKGFGRALTTGSTGQFLVNQILDETDAGFQIPTNRELVNMGLKESGAGFQVPDVPLEARNLDNIFRPAMGYGPRVGGANPLELGYKFGYDVVGPAIAGKK